MVAGRPTELVGAELIAWCSEPPFIHLPALRSIDLLTCRYRGRCRQRARMYEEALDEGVEQPGG